jgi:hypothetical protein
MQAMAPSRTHCCGVIGITSIMGPLEYSRSQNAGELDAKIHADRAQYRDHRRPALDGIILPEQSSFRSAGDQRRVSKLVIDGEKKPAPN